MPYILYDSDSVIVRLRSTQTATDTDASGKDDRVAHQGLVTGNDFPLETNLD